MEGASFGGGQRGTVGPGAEVPSEEAVMRWASPRDGGAVMGEEWPHEDGNGVRVWIEGQKTMRHRRAGVERGREREGKGAVMSTIISEQEGSSSTTVYEVIEEEEPNVDDWDADSNGSMTMKLPDEDELDDEKCLLRR
ncbi:uncharacterized protein A4U43_C06F14230 [Asparagus officinalis]|uniref:Uncharacterized protein n=1 Tax=Asparagus officinalis TaxID=4686 RepID=A0A5P1EQY8_ASPOF|nr:uncharacterized protein A4U43_C06F14230 [Asparagus officinalis]